MSTMGRIASLVMLLLAPAVASARTHGYTNKEAVKVGDELTTQMQIAPDKRAIIHDRLQGWMAETRNTKYSGLPISGVFAYHAGEGGVIVKVIRGKGLLRYYGEDTDHPLLIKSLTAGAQLGGSSEMGVGVVLGPNASKTFGGDYKMTELAATAGSASASSAELRRKGGGTGSERVVLVGTSTGLQGTAAGGKLQIIVER